MRRLFSKPDTHNQCLVKRFVSTYDLLVHIYNPTMEGD